MVSHTFIINLLNKGIYGLEFSQSEQQQQQEFSKEYQKNLKFHLKQFLTNHLTTNEVFEQNYNLNVNILTILTNGASTTTPVAPTDIDPTTQLQQYLLQF